jgi:hypothetical protein
LTKNQVSRFRIATIFPNEESDQLLIDTLICRLIAGTCSFFNHHYHHSGSFLLRNISLLALNRLSPDSSMATDPKDCVQIHPLNTFRASMDYSQFKSDVICSYLQNAQAC